jgi:hypothetical protein
MTTVLFRKHEWPSRKVFDLHGVPEKITLDKSGAATAATAAMTTTQADNRFLAGFLIGVGAQHGLVAPRYCARTYQDGRFIAQLVGVLAT